MRLSSHPGLSIYIYITKYRHIYKHRTTPAALDSEHSIPTQDRHVTEIMKDEFDGLALFPSFIALKFRRFVEVFLFLFSQNFPKFRKR